MNTRQRLAIFYERFQAAPSVRSAERAFALICRTLEEVEREFCPVPSADSPPRSFDGRMYVPQPDNIKVRDDGSIWLKTQIYYAVDRKRLVEEFRKDGEKQ